MGKIIGLAVVAILLVGGFLYWNAQNDQAATETTMGGATTATEEKSMVSSIRDAMGLGYPMRCTYALGTGQEAVVSKMYVAGKKFRTETTVGGATTQALFDGETQYIWTSGSREGMKMSQSCLQSLESMVPENNQTPVSAPQDYQQSFDTAQNVQCESVETDMTMIFSTPTDIAFTDQCAMLEQNKKMMQELKGQLPAGVTLPGM